jgi:hypothetical protein
MRENADEPIADLVAALRVAKDGFVNRRVHALVDPDERFGDLLPIRELDELPQDRSPEQRVFARERREVDPLGQSLQCVAVRERDEPTRCTTGVALDPGCEPVEKLRYVIDQGWLVQLLQ